MTQDYSELVVGILGITSPIDVTFQKMRFRRTLRYEGRGVPASLSRSLTSQELLTEISIIHNFFNSSSKSVASLTSPLFPGLLKQALKTKRPFETIMLLPSHQHIKVFEMSEPRETLSCVYHFIP